MYKLVAAFIFSTIFFLFGHSFVVLFRIIDGGHGCCRVAAVMCRLTDSVAMDAHVLMRKKQNTKKFQNPKTKRTQSGTQDYVGGSKKNPHCLKFKSSVMNFQNFRSNLRLG